MTKGTIITTIAALPFKPLVITFSRSLLLLLLLLAVTFLCFGSVINEHKIFTGLMYQAWAFKPTVGSNQTVTSPFSPAPSSANTTITQPSPNGTTNLTPSPIEFTVYTDKPTYAIGEQVTVSGNIGNRTTGDTVRIDIYNPKAIFQT